MRLATSRRVTPRELLADHREGVGKLYKKDDQVIPVRYVMDTWRQSIATGSGTSSHVHSIDGVLWWEQVELQPVTCVLEIEDGRRFNVTLFGIRSNRASFYCY